MSLKVIVFVGLIMILILLGMWRYAVLWQAEQQTSSATDVTSVESLTN